MSDSRFFICATLFSIALFGQVFFPSVSTADEDALFSDGAKVSFENGTLQMNVQGKVVWKKNLLKSAKESKSTLEVHPMDGGFEAVHLVVVSAEKKRFESVALRKNLSSKLKIVWKSDTTARGDLGERTWQAVSFDDLTGDGKPEIVVGTISESLKLCGQKNPPVLFRKVYDPVSGQLRTVAARRPGLRDPVEVEGVVNSKDEPPRPLIRIANPTGVSSLAGDRNDPLFLMPPYVLVDQDSKTAWVPGNADGAGEFATFDAAATAYGIVKVGVRSLPEGEKAKGYQAPRSLLFTTDEKVYRLRFPIENDVDAIVWFDFPKPLRSNCFSLVVESASGARGKPLAISELVLLTEIDTKEGPKRLARDLSDDKIGEQALSILRRLGSKSIEPVKKIWKTLDASGKRRAVSLFSEVGPKETAKLLAEVAVGTDEASATAARVGLEKAGEAGVMALVVFLSSELDDKFEKTARILAGFKMTKALEGLLSSAGQGGAKRRRLLRDVISISANRSEDHGQLLWRGIESAKAKGDNERLLDLLRSASAVKSLAERTSALAVPMYKETESFADRYRLLEVLALVRGEEAKGLLLEAARDRDKVIRASAVLGLAAYPGDEDVQKALLDALGDDAVMVRASALRVIGLFQPRDAEVEKLVVLASDDPWPMIRSRVLEMAGSLPVDAATGMVTEGVNDASRQVRTAAVKSAAGLPGDEVTAAVESVLSDPDENRRVIVVAADTAGVRCDESALPSLAAVLKRGAEPLALTENRQAAVAAAKAMGAIGGEEAKKLLKKIRDRSNPATDRAIDEALKSLGARCGRGEKKEEETSSE